MLRLLTFVKSVAPLVGAWIETRACVHSSDRTAVAPLVGAWIETAIYEELQYLQSVAPLVGAWIETAWQTLMILIALCRSPRGSVD